MSRYLHRSGPWHQPWPHRCQSPTGRTLHIHPLSGQGCRHKDEQERCQLHPKPQNDLVCLAPHNGTCCGLFCHCCLPQIPHTYPDFTSLPCQLHNSPPNTERCWSHIYQPTGTNAALHPHQPLHSLYLEPCPSLRTPLSETLPAFDQPNHPCLSPSHRHLPLLCLTRNNCHSSSLWTPSVWHSFWRRHRCLSQAQSIPKTQYSNSFVSAPQLRMALSHEMFSSYVFPPLLVLCIFVTIESECIWHLFLHTKPVQKISNVIIFALQVFLLSLVTAFQLPSGSFSLPCNVWYEISQDIHYDLHVTDPFSKGWHSLHREDSCVGMNLQDLLHTLTSPHIKTHLNQKILFYFPRKFYIPKMSQVK